ncbi:AI-2E family transporter [Azorhizobium oxalatiphilum]|uniref:AI-2E family transporter n=1 Tax=Azorhizobium oxalatiphilum TaxID=980631 RepID=A0A917C6Y5_9HYPH|nr:AI-2E family transporter [Azorhizobium oxalatiphilum]GGF71897.1 AI-2E family transporter [Azorhizobium oxalatiphilum]
MKALVGLAALVILCAALHLAARLVLPLVFAMLIMALVWPVHRRLAARLPRLVAALVALVIALAVVGALTSMVVWGFGRVGQWAFANAARLQAVYTQVGDWLEGHGFVLAGVVTEHFNVRWMLRLFQDLSGRLHGLASFLVITFLYVLLGLLELDVLGRKLGALGNDTGRFLLDGTRMAARKLRTYMLVRLMVSLATGAAVWAFTLASGLELALAWGAIAFAFNFVPVIGPFAATLLPTLFAIVQFETWQTALFIFACLNVIQFVSGSYLEPRFAGAALAVSPLLVLLSVFFFAFLWGLAGAFIGVPVTIAILSFCSCHPATQRIADLLSGRTSPAPAEMR